MALYDTTPLLRRMSTEDLKRFLGARNRLFLKEMKNENNQIEYRLDFNGELKGGGPWLAGLGMVGCAIVGGLATAGATAGALVTGGPVAAAGTAVAGAHATGAAMTWAGVTLVAAPTP